MKFQRYMRHVAIRRYWAISADKLRQTGISLVMIRSRFHCCWQIAVDKSALNYHLGLTLLTQ